MVRTVCLTNFAVEKRKRRAAGRVLAGAIVLLVSGLMGCRTEVDENKVSARILAAGRFEIRNGLPTLFLETSEIPCEIGQIFGVDYQVDVADGQYGRLPIEFKWVHPDLAVPSKKLWGRETPASPPMPRVEWRGDPHRGRALWSFEDPGELVAGEYEFQVRRRSDGEPILSARFEVGGC